MLSFFFFKQKTAYEMRISDWSSDVCSSDLLPRLRALAGGCRRAGSGVEVDHLGVGEHRFVERRAVATGRIPLEAEQGRGLLLRQRDHLRGLKARLDRKSVV